MPLSLCSQVSYERHSEAPGCCQSLTHAVLLGKLCSQLPEPTTRQMAELRRPEPLPLWGLGNNVTQVLRAWIVSHIDKQRWLQAPKESKQAAETCQVYHMFYNVHHIKKKKKKLPHAACETCRVSFPSKGMKKVFSSALLVVKRLNQSLKM